jgi:hypothetical protein
MATFSTCSGSIFIHVNCKQTKSSTHSLTSIQKNHVDLLTNTYTHTHTHIPETYNLKALKWIASLPVPPPAFGKPPVPRKLHFAWTSPKLEGPGTVSPAVLQRVARWQDVHPGWEVKIWTNEEVVRGFPELEPLLSNITVPSWQSDILR